jgi:hypothetical protein
VACSNPTDNPGSDQHSPLDRLTPREKRGEKMNNKQADEKKRHIAKSRGTLSFQQQLKCGMLYSRVGKKHSPLEL